MGRFENFWSSEKTSIVTLEEEEDVTDKLAYLMANPVAAQLVESGDLWPGVRRMWGMGENEITVARPDIFYSKKGQDAFRSHATAHASSCVCGHR